MLHPNIIIIYIQTIWFRGTPPFPDELVFAALVDHVTCLQGDSVNNTSRDCFVLFAASLPVSVAHERPANIRGTTANPLAIKSLRPSVRDFLRVWVAERGRRREEGQKLRRSPKRDTNPMKQRKRRRGETPKNEGRRAQQCVKNFALLSSFFSPFFKLREEKTGEGQSFDSRQRETVISCSRIRNPRC